MNVQLLQAFAGGPELLIVLLYVLAIVAFFFVLFRVVQGAVILSNKRY